MPTHQRSELSVADALSRRGEVFAIFDGRTQDSGHIAYGVTGPDGCRWFVKTAGDPSDSPGGTTYGERVAALRRAAVIQREIHHPALVPLETVIDAADGVLVVYEWFEGELLRSPPERRDDAEEASVRFRALPLAEIVGALDAVIDVHVVLERAGWVAGDFYDGCLMYDFDRRQIRLIDLEAYHHGAYLNEVGRLPGSTRFMAPEEHSRGSRIDARTTVFNLGRMLEIFVVSRWLSAEVQAVTRAATSSDPEARPPSVVALQRHWRNATSDVSVTSE